MKTEITFQSLANDTARPLRADAAFTWLQDLTPDQAPTGMPWMRRPADVLAATVRLGAVPAALATDERPCWLDMVPAAIERTRRQLRAKRSRCAFTGRFKREWEPVEQGPQWALDLDAELAPPAHRWHARSNRKYWGGC